VGDIACATIVRQLFIQGIRETNFGTQNTDSISSNKKKTETRRILDITERPYQVRGRGMTHTDGIGNFVKKDAETIQYILSNQDGTVHYQQRFLYPTFAIRHKNTFLKHLGLLIAAPVLHLQARPGASMQLADNVLYRSKGNHAVHSAARITPWLDTQRVFVRDFVYRSKS